MASAMPVPSSSTASQVPKDRLSCQLSQAPSHSSMARVGMGLSTAIEKRALNPAPRYQRVSTSR
ncbi:hypothetical protein D3C81_796940 [compost metagenome]